MSDLFCLNKKAKQSELCLDDGRGDRIRKERSDGILEFIFVYTLTLAKKYLQSLYSWTLPVGKSYAKRSVASRYFDYPVCMDNSDEGCSHVSWNLRLILIQ